ncbi:hypothetical protein KAK07_22920 [Ideonella sp. 4Y16]|uniref:Uncharacterized protein n=1 Tax=Ideonella alba TaxID=2824118 RepID=A0A940YBP1_9BURK|nr:hypothetical protein [Ideonella alba]MBQ0933579.1 hypothetical protein [Ideonella alba]MBQ0946211.1 hypothetical protein [Ideonella alba]
MLRAALMVLTGIVHSWLGERKVIAAMLRITDAALLSGVQQRFLRACRHISTVSWFVLAATLLCQSLQPQALRAAVLGISMRWPSR